MGTFSQQGFTPEQVSGLLRQAVQQTFQQLAGRNLELLTEERYTGESLPDPEAFGIAGVTASVRIGLRAKTFGGGLSMTVSRAYAEALTDRVLGSAADSYDDPRAAVEDVLGELANTVAGAVKSALIRTQFRAVLTAPVVSFTRVARPAKQPGDVHIAYLFLDDGECVLSEIILGVRQVEND